MRKLQIVPLSRMEEMRKMFNEYLTELSQFDPDIKFDENGVPIYAWYDCYWEEKQRYPFYFILDDNIAGLAMIRELENMCYDIAEFYVAPEYRKDGNAIWFATEITKLFEGQFTFSTRFTNPRAIKFWDKFAKMFESNSYVDDDIWRSWSIRKNCFKEHTLNLNPIYFDLIKSGEKTLEGRLNDDKRKLFEVGDKITFFKEPERVETIKAIILKKYIYKNCHTLVYKSIRRHLQANNLYYYYQYELYCIYRINLVMPTNLLFLMTEIVYAHIAYQTHKNFYEIIKRTLWHERNPSSHIPPHQS